MSIAAVSMGSPFSWLSKSLDVGRRYPGALFGGFAFLLVVAMLPTALQMLLQLFIPQSMGLMFVVMAVALVFGLVVMPPMMGGAFQLLHRCETGAAPSAMDVFDFYREPPMAVRMILTALLVMLSYCIGFGLLFLLPGGSFFIEVMKIAMEATPGVQPDLSGLTPPSGILLWMLAAIFMGIFLGNAYFLAMIQAALGGRAPVSAIGDGVMASLKNMLPMIGFFLVLMIGSFIAILILAVVAGLVLGALALISQTLMFLIAVPLYMGFLLLVYVVMFGFYYHAWRDIFPDAANVSVNAAEVIV